MRKWWRKKKCRKKLLKRSTKSLPSASTSPKASYSSVSWQTRAWTWLMCLIPVRRPIATLLECGCTWSYSPCSSSFSLQSPHSHSFSTSNCSDCSIFPRIRSKMTMLLLKINFLPFKLKRLLATTKTITTSHLKTVNSLEFDSYSLLSSKLSTLPSSLSSLSWL